MCKCDCGNETIVVGGRLNYGTTKSCGCLKREITSIVRKKHNTYDLSGEYGIVYTSKGEEFWFDKEDYDKVKDYYWRKDEKHIEKQKMFFIEQIKIANELHLPIIVHDREAHKDTIDILKKYPPLYGCVIHCFSGSLEMMKECVKLGFYIGLDGPVTYKNAIVPKEVAKAVPLERLLLETDAPYLPPVPFRGQKNYPEYIKYIIKEIATLRNVTENEIEETTFSNGKVFFGV